MTNCCGSNPGHEIHLWVREGDWLEMRRALAAWQEINAAINAGPHPSDLYDSEFELRGEVADAVERLVENAKPGEPYGPGHWQYEVGQ